jgi:hypothetical protein
MNTLNYKKKNNIYNTHYYINTHVVGHRRVRTKLGVGTNASGPERHTAVGLPYQSGLLPRPKRQVALGFAPRIGAAQALGGALVCPSATWCMGHGKGLNYLLIFTIIKSITIKNSIICGVNILIFIIIKRITVKNSIIFVINIISCGINNTIFIISNNILITMGSATWRLGCHSQLGFLPRPKRQVALGSTPSIGAAQEPGGARVFPSATWLWATIVNRAFC